VWPEGAVVQPNWFFKWNDRPRAYNCDFGWYLMELNDPGWRTRWSRQVIEQLRDNEDDGLFADSFSIPNYGFTWNPGLRRPNLRAISVIAARTSGRTLIVSSINVGQLPAGGSPDHAFGAYSRESVTIRPIAAVDFQKRAFSMPQLLCEWATRRSCGLLPVRGHSGTVLSVLRT